MQVQYRVTLDVLHLEKASDGSIVLDACWSIPGNDGEKLPYMKRSKIVMAAESAGFGGIASAESKAVEALSREMAAAIQSLRGKALVMIGGSQGGFWGKGRLWSAAPRVLHIQNEEERAR